MLQDTSLDPSFDDNIAFRTASRIGHTDVVRLLLLDFRVNASANDNEAITEASKGGHVNIVRDITSNASFDRKFDRRFCDKLLNEAIKIKKSASKGSEIK